MSNADRIEELRTKYEENPRRYFAPLANEFRKAGDLAQAIAICREHLPKQPGHMSGYIVFGQTLYEANNLEEARSVFEQALALDPENLIALKHLGDIARMSGENAVARRWYARVLDADPRNDDIASQLASLGSPTPVMPVHAVVAPAPAPAPGPQLEDKPGVFATFDPSSLLDLHDDVGGIYGTSAHVNEPTGHASRASSQPPAEASDLPDFAHGDQAAERAEQEARFDARHEPLDLDFPDDPEPVADEQFEEGILAPEWPDTTELVARIVTPLRSVTPLSVPATVEAVEAFGRETSDPLEPAFVDLPLSDELVDAFLPVDATPHSEPEPTTGVVDTDVTAEFAIPGHWTPDQPVTVPVADGSEPDWDVPDFVDEPVAAAPTVHKSDPAGDSSFEMIDDVSAEPANEFLEPFTVDSTDEVVGELTAEFTGETETIEVPEESFAAVSSELESDRAEAEQEADTPPTFVTETMAELLVSQGFVSRAIEVYVELVRHRPHDLLLAARLYELRSTEQAEAQHLNEPTTQQPGF
ncbi:MAG: tetratricopeptide repeat protein, partial [Phycisphaerae bacterium]|nr:tetratricopeptide repeat protein [Gemmatimonadaceae bacterium]